MEEKEREDVTGYGWKGGDAPESERAVKIRELGWVRTG